LAWEPDEIDPDAPKPDVPAELVLLQELETWQVLPVKGGYLDQPATLMADLRAVRQARNMHPPKATVQSQDDGDHYAQLVEKARRAAGGFS